MAGRFRCDPHVAGQVSQELMQIRADMTAAGRTIDGYDDATGSRRVQDALHDFFADSSDNREKMSDLLERAAGLLRGLAEGSTAVDKGLAGALEPQQQPAPAGGR